MKQTYFFASRTVSALVCILSKAFALLTTLKCFIPIRKANFKVLFNLSTLLAGTLVFSSCVLYKSPDRKDFESEHPQFQISSLSKTSCHSTSVISLASASRLVYLKPEEVSLWEHIVNQHSVFESNNFKDEFCIYENIHAKKEVNNVIE